MGVGGVVCFGLMADRGAIVWCGEQPACVLVPAGSCWCWHRCHTSRCALMQAALRLAIPRHLYRNEDVIF